MMKVTSLIVVCLTLVTFVALFDTGAAQCYKVRRHRWGRWRRNIRLHRCTNGATCIPKPKGYSCLCKPGYKGSTCAWALGARKWYPADSCQQLYEHNFRRSGLYWVMKRYGRIRRATRVYCKMTAGGGWTHVGTVDPYRTRRCPGSLRYISSPRRMCIKSTGSSCNSAYFIPGIPYNEVRGYTYGYQFASPDGFSQLKAGKGTASINQPYVDGISLTHGPSSNRQHIWTFAVGYTRYYRAIENCPCDKYPGRAPPAFVGSDYYCESSNIHRHWARTWYRGNLWDGGCYAQSSCCNRSGQPWFIKRLFGTTRDRLEVRLCMDQGLNDENVGLIKMELYVR